MYVPLNCISTYSLLHSPTQVSRLAKKCQEMGFKSAGITELGNLASSVAWVKECQEVGLRPIIGQRLYLCEKNSHDKGDENTKLSHVTLLCKNLSGWKNLVKLTSLGNKPESWLDKPRLSLDEVVMHSNGQNLIAISGGPYTELANALFTTEEAYRAETYDIVKGWIHKDWIGRLTFLIQKYQGIFGSDNFYIEIQTIDKYPAAVAIVNGLRYIAKKLNVPTVATPNPYYLDKDDSFDQRVLLCSMLGKTFNNVKDSLEKNINGDINRFFERNNFHLPSYEELLVHNTKEELEATNEIEAKIEEFSILAPPVLPRVQLPDGETPYHRLRELCLQGWEKKIRHRIPADQHPIYQQRVKEELSIIQKAELDSYLIIVQDYIEYIRKRGGLVSPGRGSIGGSLVAYLAGITEINSVIYKLLFSRFYSSERKGSLPDVDTDFDLKSREEVIEYIKQKYGERNVGQIVTFGRLNGRGVIKEVLRVHNACSFTELNAITEHIPDEAKIIDDLEEMRSDGEEPSILMWSLRNHSKELENWCSIDKKSGELQGPLSKLFEQAIRLEGSLKTQGRHASGLIISPIPLDEACPVIRSTSGNESICGLEYEFAEQLGLVKFDILGIAVSSKIMETQKLLKERK